jgi:hypothetical protein
MMSILILKRIEREKGDNTIIYSSLYLFGVFLGSIASVEGLKLDPVKVKAITEWLHLSPWERFIVFLS